MSTDTEHPEELDDLLEQLDAAGRLSQPASPGWDDLVERLPAQGPQLTGTRVVPVAPESKPQRSHHTALAISLVGLVGVVIAILTFVGPGGRAIADGPVEVQRRGVSVTVFNKTEQQRPTLLIPGLAPAEALAAAKDGMLLVKDERLVLRLRKGDNVVRFTDVAATIDPTSVRLISLTDPLHTRVVEQNFEFDLATADTLLQRALEDPIVCVGRDGTLQEGHLLSFDSEVIILADKLPQRSGDSPDAAGGPADENVTPPQTEVIPRNTLQALRLSRVPQDLQTRPTLVWTLRTERPGNHETVLTYLCGLASWEASYLVTLNEPDGQVEGEAVDVQAWVTIDNRTGATYENAGLKLLAGDVNRVADPWAPPPPRRATRRFLGRESTRDFFADRFVKEFAEKAFFEYKLYTLNRPSTIRDRQIKQLSLFRASGVQARRTYVCSTQATPGNRAAVELTVENKKDNQLGRPLPKGSLAITAVDADGDDQFLSRTTIDHTARDETLTLSLGYAADVIRSFRVVNVQQQAGVSHRVEEHEFRIRNHKSRAVKVRVVAVLNGNRNWTIPQSSDPHTKHDYQTIHFDFELEADSEKTITYTVDYRW